ncbi:MAG: aspartyl protease family protein, partial [Bacteroidales bacterium]|nr:aspartyl protease family protein [Bacteroidales bacterium]
MKPVKKSTLFLLIYVILGIAFTFLSIKYLYSTQYNRSTAVNLIPTKSLGVILPIEIKGKVFHFLWDTGSSHSSISQQAVDSIEMDS